MLLTKECDYAIRIVRGLSDGSVRSVKSLSELEYVPIPFAYKILKKLVEGKIVVAHRGNAGGYQLVRDLEELTLLEILEKIDQRLLLNECLQDGYQCPKNGERGDACAVHKELCRLQSVLVEGLTEKSINEILSNV